MEHGLENHAGRLFDLPRARLRPIRRPLGEYWATAPEWLRVRARRPLTPAQETLWDALRDGRRLGTDAVAKVPVWIPQWEVGYVLDFLLPAFGLNIQIDTWDSVFLDVRSPEPGYDFDADPDHPENFVRDHDLLEAEGIETISYWDDAVHEMGGAGIAAEIRRELGLGR